MATDPLMPAAEPETERRNERTADIDQLSALGIVQLMNEEDATVSVAVREELPRIAQAIDAIADRLRQGGRLIYLGAGTSGRLGVLDASECPPTFSTPPDLVIGRIAGGDEALRHSIENAEDSEELGRAEIDDLKVMPSDAVVGIAASGRTPYVLAAMEAAKARGALTIGLACNAGSPLASRVDIMIAPVVGPEVIAGSTRLKAGTAQKMVLNMLSTGTMILIGKTYGNLMVDFNP
ncbi:MAG TPA: N-acetylmuramic acid 6-phosphate etherase, partial [Thermomicrobiales bacterium]|nr:N-acetylmuramic acid 6-phosphate etherase [Thermomicrobiales bacterium]